MSTHEATPDCLFVEHTHINIPVTPVMFCYRHNDWAKDADIRDIKAGLCPDCGYDWRLHGPWHPSVNPPAALAACPNFAATLRIQNHG